MDFQTYKEKTDKAVAMLTDLGYLLATVEQANMDTNALIFRMNKVKDIIETQIRTLKDVDIEVKSDNDQAEYETFVKDCENGKHKVIKWCSLPNRAKDMIMEDYAKQVKSLDNVTSEQWYKYIGEAADSFKKQHNIEKIEL